MKKNYICINSDYIESVSVSLNSISNSTIEGGIDFFSSSSNVRNSKLMNSSSNKVFSQSKVLGNVLEKGKIMLLKSLNEMINTEMYLNSIAESIVVPKNFSINSSSFSSEVDSVNLIKNDGVSVSGGNANLNDLEFNSVVNYNKKLKDIVNDYEMENEKIVFSFDKKDNLENISNDSLVNDIDMKDRINLKEVNLSNVNYNSLINNSFVEVEVSDDEIESKS